MPKLVCSLIIKKSPSSIIQTFMVGYRFHEAPPQIMPRGKGLLEVNDDPRR